jgi:hypothetical protein
MMAQKYETYLEVDTPKLANENNLIAVLFIHTKILIH